MTAIAPPITKWPTLRQIDAFETTGRISARRAEALRVMARTHGVVNHKFGFSDLCIRTKDKRFITFDPNEVQARYMDSLCPGWRDGDVTMTGLQEIILKARQFGFSTLIGALFFLDTINTPGTGTVVISNDKPNSEKLFEMIDRMYRHLPEKERPRTQRANTNELYWPDIDCHYEVMTAGTRTSGRGWTINNLHCSEVGFWEYPDVLGGLLDAVPAGGNIFLESTANGEGSEQQDEDGETIISGSAFHVFYERAKEGRSPYRANFFAWYEHSEYRLDPPEDFIRTNEDTERLEPMLYARYGNEERLVELYGLDDAQLFWRRQMIEKPGKGPAMFCQEYPANDVEAFRTSGKKFFAGQWNQDIHVEELAIKSWWVPLGGFDWGFSVPYCFLLGWAFPFGDGVGVYVSDELYGARIRNTQQAQEVIDLMSSRGIGKREMTTYAEPAMWSKEGGHKADFVGRANIEDFWDAKLDFIKANNNREHGCINMREYMMTPGALFVSPRCVNLIRTIGMVLHDPHDLEVYEKSETAEQHPVDALRYLLNSRPYGKQPPKRELTPEEQQQRVQDAAKNNTRLMRENMLKVRNKAQGIVPKRDDDGNEMRDDDGNLVWMEERKGKRR
jgi:hypothetical protein